MFGLSGRISGEASAVIRRPIQSVFDFVGHGFFENYPRWNPQVVEFEPMASGPAGPGALARQVTLDRGVRAESTFEITSFDPPRMVAVKGISQPFGSHYFLEREADDATRISFRFEIEERRIFMRPFRQLLRESLQKGAQRTVEILKQTLETEYVVDRSPERLARFIYVTSLDLQEPLRKVEAFSDLLENAIASANKSDMAYAQQALRSYAFTARKLVDDLLTYSSTIVAGQHLEVLDLREEIEATLKEIGQAISNTESDVRVEAPSRAFLADRQQFACLLRNILTNAIKYRKPGEGAKVRISAEPEDNKCFRLSIIDSGVGFKEEFAHAIFEPFRQFPRKTEYPGTGIELAICKSIADRHGWDVAVKARPGEGAGFYFTIPEVRRDNTDASLGLAAEAV